MTTHEPTSITAELDQLTSGLDLSDADDRAAFRMRVTDRYRHAKLSAIRDDVRNLEREVRQARPVQGPERVGHSRADALRALTSVFIISRQLGDI